tara:strand:+ start:349 stop:624 length:276 start_codon:yes stop_codon:yes gene_type:complete
MAFKMKGYSYPGKSPMNKKEGKKVVGENTSEIKKDKKGKDYALIMEDSKNFTAGDTIRPGNAPRVDNYIMGGDYKTEKKGKKNYKITGDAK